VNKINLRFGKNRKDGCCILLGPELCQNPAFYQNEHGYVFCEGHGTIFRATNKWERGFQPSEYSDAVYGPYRTCDKVLLKQFCENSATWQYNEINDELNFICEYHAMKFKAIRPTFEDPLPKGYAGKRRENDKR